MCTVLVRTYLKFELTITIIIAITITITTIIIIIIIIITIVVTITIITIIITVTTIITILNFFSSGIVCALLGAEFESKNLSGQIAFRFPENV